MQMTQVHCTVWGTSRPHWELLLGMLLGLLLSTAGSSVCSALGAASSSGSLPGNRLHICRPMLRRLSISPSTEISPPAGSCS